MMGRLERPSSATLGLLRSGVAILLLLAFARAVAAVTSTCHCECESERVQHEQQQQQQQRVERLCQASTTEPTGSLGLTFSAALQALCSSLVAAPRPPHTVRARRQHREVAPLPVSSHQLLLPAIHKRDPIQVSSASAPWSQHFPRSRRSEGDNQANCSWSLVPTAEVFMDTAYFTDDQVLVVAGPWTNSCNGKVDLMNTSSTSMLISTGIHAFVASCSTSTPCEAVMQRIKTLYISVGLTQPDVQSLPLLLAQPLNLTTFGLRNQYEHGNNSFTPDIGNALPQGLLCLDLQNNGDVNLDSFQPTTAYPLVEGALNNLHQLQVLNLQSNWMTQLPPGMFDSLQQLQELKLSQNNLNGLPPGVFERLQSLRHLDLSAACDNNLSSTALNGLAELLFLDLSFLRVSLDSAGFRGLFRLETLNMESTTSSFAAGAFDDLHQLQSLAMKNNDLTSLPSGLFDHVYQLQTLDLSENSLAALPEGFFDHACQLRTLNFNANRLTSLPVGLLDCTGQLQSIKLNQNSLTSLPTGLFAAASQLQVVELAENALTALPAGIFERASQLQTLHLNKNGLAALPTSVFQDATQLRKLNLEENVLTTLPDGVFSTTLHLQTVTLNNNHLTSIPAGLFANTGELQSIKLDNNRLTVLPDRTFGKSNLLQRLSLTYNRLTRIEANGWDSLSQLQQLDLAENCLSALPKGIFNSLSQLQSLVLANNALAGLAPGMFDHMRQLQRLNLNGNSLTLLPSHVFAGTPNLQELRMTANPIGTLPKDWLTALTNLVSLDIANSRLTQLDLDLLHMPDLKGLRIGRDDCPTNYAVHLNFASAARLQQLDLTGATVSGLDNLAQHHLTELGLDLSLDTPTLAFEVTYPDLVGLTISCFKRTTSLRLDLPPGSQLSTLQINRMPNLRSISLGAGLPALRLFNVSSNPQLSVVTWPQANQLDVSQTNVSWSPHLCQRAGTHYLAALAMVQPFDWPQALQHCLNVGTKIIDFSENHILDVEAIAGVFASRVFIGNSDAKGCIYYFLADGSTPVCGYEDLPTLQLRGVPLQCGLQPTTDLVVQWDGTEAQTFGEQSFQCECSPGYEMTGEPTSHRCTPKPPPVYRRPWFVALMVMLGFGLLGGVVAFIQRYRRRLRLTKESHEYERELLSQAYLEDVAELKEAWRILRSEIALEERIDGDSPGAFGEVWRAQWQGFSVCVKVLKASATLDTAAVEDFQKELELLQRTRHPQLVRFFGAGEGAFDGQAGVPFLVLELVSLGSLRSVLRGCQPRDLNLSQRLLILRDVATGLAYLHELGHAHRDVKAGNVLITKQFRAKVTDFGSVKLRQRALLSRTQLQRGPVVLDGEAAMIEIGDRREQSFAVGTPLYMAPEVLTTGRNGGYPADVFAFGVVMWETLTGQAPDLCLQEGKRRGPLMTVLSQLLEAGKRLDTDSVLTRCPDVPKTVVTLMHACWTLDPTTRPTLKLVLMQLEQAS